MLRQLVEEIEVDTFAGPGTDDEWFNRNARLDLAKGVNIRAAEVHDRRRVVERSTVSGSAVVDQLAPW